MIMLCYITHDMNVIEHTLLSYKTHMSCCIAHVMLCYITPDMLCYVTHDII